MSAREDAGIPLLPLVILPILIVFAFTLDKNYPCLLEIFENFIFDLRKNRIL